MKEVEVKVKTFDDGRGLIFSQAADTRKAYIRQTLYSDYENGVPQMFNILVPLTDEEAEVYDHLLMVDPSGITGVPMNNVTRSRIEQL
jgi:hypothetical protein